MYSWYISRNQNDEHAQGRGVSTQLISINTAGPLRSFPRCTSTSSTSLLTSLNSSSLSFTFAAPIFSSQYLTVLLPGSGMMSGAVARSQAIVTWAAVALLCALPMAVRASTRALMRGKLAAENLGIMRRKSFSSKSSGDFCERRNAWKLD